MNLKNNTVEFYNQESSQYSRKRYEGPLISYHQYVFRHRMKIFFHYIHSLNKRLSLFDIGCADGVVLRTLDDEFPDVFTKIVGVDIAPGMVAQAEALTKEHVHRDPTRMSFYLRGQEPQMKYDLVTELGVHVSDVRKEIEYVASHLSPEGYYIYAVAGKDSLHARCKLKNNPEAQWYYSEYLSYSDIEKILLERFEVIRKYRYGFFVPKLWSLPVVARVMQPCIEMFARSFLPNLFHETIYLLKLRADN